MDAGPVQPPAEDHGHRAPALSPPPYVGFALLAVSVAIWALVSALVFHGPFYLGVRRLNFFDLHVYRAAARDVLSGRPIYDTTIYRGMDFTYPPFGELVTLPSALVSPGLGSVISVAVNLACLLGILRLTASLLGPAGRAEASSSPKGWGATALVAGVLLWSEPVSTAVGYGQVDLIVALLVVWDLTRAPDSRAAGIGVGLAGALKLTPLIFIPYLLLSGRRRAGLVAAGVFLLTIAAGYAVLPSDSARYWGGAFIHSSRTGNVADAANQSLTGLITRLTATTRLSAPWLALDCLVGILGVAVAVRLARRDERGAAFAICALTSLLVSPVSWTHHWVLMIPAVVALADWARRDDRRWVQVLLAAAAVAGFLYLPAQLGEGANVGLGAFGPWVTMPYVLFGCAILAIVGVRAARTPARDGG